MNTKHIGAIDMYSGTKWNFTPENMRASEEKARPTSTELLCAEISSLRTALKSAKQALELGLLAAKHCREEIPNTENVLDVIAIEAAIENAERAIFGTAK
jgi:hypothetical protein